MSEEKKILDVLVVGGGITGLCLGTLLKQQYPNNRFLVLESADAPGGTARTDRTEGYICDWGPNGFLDKEPKTLEWVKSLGLEDSIQRANENAAKRFIYRHNKLHELKPPPAFLLSSVLSLQARLRLLCEPLIRARGETSPETVWGFAARRIGSEAADVLVSSMVSGVFGGNAHELEMGACFPRLAEMEQQYGSLLKALRAIKANDPKASPMGPKGVLTTFKGGLGTLAETAASKLGDHLQCGVTITAINRENDCYKVVTDNGVSYTSQNIVIALPTHAASKILRDITPKASEALSEIPYAGLAVVCTGYPESSIKHNLNGFGFLIPRLEGKRILGCIWTHSLFPGTAPKGHALLRTMIGGATDPDAVHLSDTQLSEIIRDELHPILGIDKEPTFVRIFRHPRGIPQYTLGHSNRLQHIYDAEKNNPRMYFAGNAYRGISLNECIVSAYEVLNRLKIS